MTLSDHRRRMRLWRFILVACALVQACSFVVMCELAYGRIYVVIASWSMEVTVSRYNIPSKFELEWLRLDDHFLVWLKPSVGLSGGALGTAWVRVPHCVWMLIAAMCFWWHRRQSRRLGTGVVCEHCGYDRAGTAPGRCPECGECPPGKQDT